MRLQRIGISILVIVGVLALVYGYRQWTKRPIPESLFTRDEISFYVGLDRDVLNDQHLLATPFASMIDAKTLSYIQSVLSAGRYYLIGYNTAEGVAPVLLCLERSCLDHMGPWETSEYRGVGYGSSQTPLPLSYISFQGGQLVFLDRDLRAKDLIDALIDKKEKMSMETEFAYREQFIKRSDDISWYVSPRFASNLLARQSLPSGTRLLVPYVSTYAQALVGSVQRQGDKIVGDAILVKQPQYRYSVDFPALKAPIPSTPSWTVFPNLAKVINTSILSIAKGDETLGLVMRNMLQEMQASYPFLFAFTDMTQGIVIPRDGSEDYLYFSESSIPIDAFVAKLRSHLAGEQGEVRKEGDRTVVINTQTGSGMTLFEYPSRADLLGVVIDVSPYRDMQPGSSNSYANLLLFQRPFGQQHIHGGVRVFDDTLELFWTIQP